VPGIRRTLGGRARAAAGAGGAAFLDELRDGVHRPQDAVGGLLVADRHAELALDGQHELEGVDGIEAQPLAEQPDVVRDLGRRIRQPEALHEHLFDSRPKRLIHRNRVLKC
jgi:hypothetical protein